MSPNPRDRVAIAVLVVALVVGTAAVATEATSSSDDAPAQATTTTVAQRMAVSITNLSSPERVRVGTSFTVSATVVNRGDASTLRRVVYRIAGNAIAARYVRIPADATTSVTFDIAGADTAGFPTGTFTHGVVTDDAEATANLTLAPGGETTTARGTTGTVSTTTVVTTPVETTAPETTTPAEATTTARTATSGPRAASITFEQQSSNGTAVTVRSVTVPEGGFVVVHDTGVVRGDVTGSILGVSRPLDAGTYRNVTVRLDERLTESRRLVAIAYRDSNGNREYDFVTSNRTVDGPYTIPGEREAVNDIAHVTIEATDETTETTEASNATTVSESPARPAL